MTTTNESLTGDEQGPAVTPRPIVQGTYRVKDGRIILPCYKPGDRVSYTSKAGNVNEYLVIEKWVEEIMYGVYRGSKSIMLKLGKSMGDRGFTVPATKVVKL